MDLYDFSRHFHIFEFPLRDLVVDVAVVLHLGDQEPRLVDVFGFKGLGNVFDVFVEDHFVVLFDAHEIFGRFGLVDLLVGLHDLGQECRVDSRQHALLF